MSPLLGNAYKNEIGNSDLLFYGPEDKVHGLEMIDLVKKWYQTAMSLPDPENPLMGDDLDGAKNKKFLVPLDGSTKLLICGGSWEKPALQKGNENRVFVRRAVIDTKTVVLVSILNVILLPGGHKVTAKNLINSDDSRKVAFNEMNEAMEIDKVFARFKITGPHPAAESTKGIILTERDLVKISTPLDKPFTDVDQVSGLETDPDDWNTLHIRDKFPSYTSGYYACFEIKTPGTYIVDIDGNAPLAGHQDEHEDESLNQKLLETSKFHLDEKMFHNSSRYELNVSEA